MPMERGRRIILSCVRSPASLLAKEGCSGSEELLGTHHCERSIDTLTGGVLGHAYAKEWDENDHEDADIEPAQEVAHRVGNLCHGQYSCSPGPSSLRDGIAYSKVLCAGSWVALATSVDDLHGTDTEGLHECHQQHGAANLFPHTPKVVSADLSPILDVGS